MVTKSFYFALAGIAFLSMAAMAIGAGHRKGDVAHRLGFGAVEHVPVEHSARKALNPGYGFRD